MTNEAEQKNQGTPREVRTEYSTIFGAPRFAALAGAAVWRRVVLRISAPHGSCLTMFITEQAVKRREFLEYSSKDRN